MNAKTIVPVILLVVIVIVVGLLAIVGGIFAWIKNIRSLALVGLICSIVLLFLMVIFAIIMWS